MSPRERVLKAIKFEYPDRAPVIHAHLPGGLLRHKEKLIALYRRYPNDFYPVNSIKIPKSEKNYYRGDGSFYKEETDEWGCLWVSYYEGITGQVKRHPLSDLERLGDYRIPSPVLLTSEDIERERKTFGDFPVWVGGIELFQRMSYLRGFANLLMDIAEGREELYLLMDRILNEYAIPFIRNRMKMRPDIASFADDWGSQQSLLVKPEAWRKIFKPRYKKMFDICHEGGALVWFHSDGMILDIIPDLIEIGVNVLNPQFSCHKLNQLRELCHGRVCISTDIDRQRLLPNGTPGEIREYVRQAFSILGSSKGGILARGEIGPDVPLRNAEAMLSAFYEFGSFQSTDAYSGNRIFLASFRNKDYID